MQNNIFHGRQEDDEIYKFLPQTTLHPLENSQAENPKRNIVYDSLNNNYNPKGEITANPIAAIHAPPGGCATKLESCCQTNNSPLITNASAIRNSKVLIDRIKKKI